MVECEITIATAAGRHTGIYRLTTTLLDDRRHPAAALVTLYHHRWEIETACLELKSSIHRRCDQHQRRRDPDLGQPAP